MRTCPKCLHKRSNVVDTRERPLFIKRRRVCQKCEWSWYTVEVYVRGQCVDDVAFLIEYAKEITLADKKEREEKSATKKSEQQGDRGRA